MGGSPGGEIVEVTQEEWLEALEDIGEERGYFEPLGPRHSVIFTDAGPTLLVTFETIDGIMDAEEDGLPAGFSLADAHGWSQLCLLGHDDGWFRARPVYLYFDRLVDDGFFEDFDRVVFYGSEACAYAAAAFSVAAPGCTVLAIQPRATLDGGLANWDQRDIKARRAFTSPRYSFAPRMIDAADHVYVFYDPRQRLDAIHATMFNAEHVSRMRMRLVGEQIERDLRELGILEALIAAAMEGRMDDATWYQLWRARRAHLPLLRNYLTEVVAAGNDRQTVLLCRHVLRKFSAPRFRRAGEAAVAALRSRDVIMSLDQPPPRRNSRDAASKEA